MSRLIAVSNRVQTASDDCANGNQGGLAVALSAAMRERNGIWFGWSGEETANFNGHVHLQKMHGVTTATIDLEHQDIQEYYNGYANCTLWPLFHYRIDLTAFDRSFAGGYERVNQRFAETLIPLLEPDDLIWVNDYHLIPLGRELRVRERRNRLGFFLHIPWPPMRLLLSLPNHRELVEALFAYDVIGFQTTDWMDSFLDYVRVEIGLTPDKHGVMCWNGRSVKVVACPIGLDTENFRAHIKSDMARSSYQSMIESANGRAMIIGVDRLDYCKGVQERFRGYERFLADRPDLRAQIFLLQISPPSRSEVLSYQDIRHSLETLSGHINGAYASPHWVPIRYVNQGFSRAELAGMYRAARIGLVTPLRDGMNIVAKEYIAAQDPEDPGVLILSRFAGAAAQLTAALQVNPYSSEDISDAIAKALAMPKAERVARWEQLIAIVQRQDMEWWRDRFVGHLADQAADCIDR